MAEITVFSTEHSKVSEWKGYTIISTLGIIYHLHNKNPSVVREGHPKDYLYPILRASKEKRAEFAEAIKYPMPSDYSIDRLIREMN